MIRLFNDHFPQKISLNKHIKEVHKRKKNEVICKICENTFRTQQSLKRHVVSIHEEKKLYECETCGKNFGLQQNLRTHIK